jgi:hypothetical protein
MLCYYAIRNTTCCAGVMLHAGRMSSSRNQSYKETKTKRQSEGETKRQKQRQTQRNNDKDKGFEISQRQRLLLLHRLFQRIDAVTIFLLLLYGSLEVIFLLLYYSVQPPLRHFRCPLQRIHLRLKFLFHGLYCLLQESNLAVLIAQLPDRQK